MLKQGEKSVIVEGGLMSTRLNSTRTRLLLVTLALSITIMLAFLTETRIRAEGSPSSLPICPSDPGPYVAPAAPPTPIRPGTGGEGAVCQDRPTGQFSPTGLGPARSTSAGIQTVGGHWLGAQTPTSNLSIWGQLFVSDPATRIGTEDFVAVRFLEKCCAPDEWIEGGWIKGWFKSGNDRCIYVGTQPGTYQTFCQYALTIGQGYYIQLVDDGGPNNWSLYLYWAGGWRKLFTQSMSFAYAPAVEEYVEIFNQDGVHFNVPRTDVGTPVQIYTGATFQDWTAANFPNTQESNWDNPYETHWLRKYDDWYVHKHN